MAPKVRHRVSGLLCYAAIALGALLLVTSFAAISFNWRAERLTLAHGGATLTYWSTGCSWGDLAHWPRAGVCVEPPWNRDELWSGCYWRPLKGGFSFVGSQRVAYFPVYMLLPPLVLAAWLLRVPNRTASSCNGCGYNLTGNVSGRCPECGTVVATPPPVPEASTTRQTDAAHPAHTGSHDEARERGGRIEPRVTLNRSPERSR